MSGLVLNRCCCSDTQNHKILMRRLFCFLIIAIEVEAKGFGIVQGISSSLTSPFVGRC